MKRLLLLLLTLPLLAACGVTGPLRIQPQHAAKTIAPSFDQSLYYFDRDQDLFFVMRASTTNAAGKTEDQFLTIRVFWKPRGGVTTLNPSAINATFRYIVMTPDAQGMYEGAGFVRLDSDPDDSNFAARIIDAEMRLTQASNSFVDTLGRAHLAGAFSAAYDDAKAVDLLQAAQQEFFARSLQARPAATAPATMVP
jgi:predicted small lipoprotein YifL